MSTRIHFLSGDLGHVFIFQIKLPYICLDDVRGQRGGLKIRK